MTDKLTDKDIIKALPNMTYGGHYCAKCKYDNGKGNDRCGLKGCKIARYALDLITRQKTENENLKVENQSLRSAANSFKMHYEEAQAEIERLKNALLALTNYLNIIGCDESDVSFIKISTDLNKQIRADIKSEAYKEVFEKLNKKAKVEKIIDKNFPFIIRVVTLHDINELKKEMVDD